MTQVSRSTWSSSLTTKIDSNGANGVTATDVREVFADLEDSVKWFDEVTVLEDTTPQLGGDLDVNGNDIVSTSNGDINILPNGTGNVVLGNYTLNADATVGASQDNYVLTYDDASGTWGPEAATGGGGGGYTETQIKGFAGELFTGNTETLITVTYQSSDNTVDLVVDNDLANYSNTNSGFVTAATAPVRAVAGKTGNVVLAASDIASGTMANARIAEASVTQHQAALSIATSQLTSTIGTSQIADEAVTLAKQAHIATGTLLGRSTAGTGDVEALTTATVLKGKPEAFTVAVSDETSDLTTGTGKLTFRMPYAFTVTAVRASVKTAPTGSTIIVDINESGSSILSTKLTIDATEKTSTTAATAAVISDASLADDAEMTIDIDQIGSSVAGAGLKVTLIGTQT